MPFKFCKKYTCVLCIYAIKYQIKYFLSFAISLINENQLGDTIENIGDIERTPPSFDNSLVPVLFSIKSTI